MPCHYLAWQERVSLPRYLHILYASRFRHPVTPGIAQAKIPFARPVGGVKLLPFTRPPIMNKDPLDPAFLAQKISQSEAKLNRLEHEIEEIGQPAAQDLTSRMAALKIEENALKRNFAEARQSTEPDTGKLQKIDTLLRHIEQEESSVEHEAGYLNQAALSSVTLAVPAGTHVVELFRQGADRSAGNHGAPDSQDGSADTIP